MGKRNKNSLHLICETGEEPGALVASQGTHVELSLVPVVAVGVRPA